MQCVSLHDYLNDPAGQPCHLVLNADFSFDSRCFLLRLHWRRRRSAHTPSGALRLDARGNVRNWWWWRWWYRSCCSFVLRESFFFHQKTHLSEAFNTETCFHGIEEKKRKRELRLLHLTIQIFVIVYHKSDFFFRGYKGEHFEMNTFKKYYMGKSCKKNGKFLAAVVPEKNNEK